MKKLILALCVLATSALLQACANGGAELQSPNVGDNPNATGQNMNYMYRSPSYQIGRIR